jgi:hypothetical protein
VVEGGALGGSVGCWVEISGTVGESSVGRELPVDGGCVGYTWNDVIASVGTKLAVMVEDVPVSC